MIRLLLLLFLFGCNQQEPEPQKDRIVLCRTRLTKQNACLSSLKGCEFVNKEEDHETRPPTILYTGTNCPE